MSERPHNLDTALDALSKGYAPIPCNPGKKIPMERWLRWQTELPPEALVRQWFCDPLTNVALICTGAVVIDVDDSSLLDFVLQECGDTPEKVRTPRGGFHLPYRAPDGVKLGNHVKVNGMPIDIRTNRGLRVLPPSRTEYGAYEWIEGGLTPVADLPIAHLDWAHAQEPQMLTAVPEITGEPNDRVRRAWAYVAKIEGAVSGQHGHDQAMRVAGVLIQKFGLTVDEALPIFSAWSDRCSPPWSVKERMHKLQDAERLKGTARALR